MNEATLKFSKIVDRQKKTAEMALYGELGSEVNGHYFAQELHWLGEYYDEITIRVNSGGGNVLDGLSIVSEMLASNAVIVVRIEGIAASMAAVLLGGADTVEMNDYAKVMIHSPYYTDENGDEINKLSAKEKKGLDSIKSTLVTLLTKRGIAETRVNELMKTDSWFTADEAKAEGLVDKILTTGKKAERAALDIKALAAAVKLETTFNKIEMKNVIAKLNTLGAKLADDASEAQINEAIDTYMKPAPVTPAAPSQTVIDALVVAGKKQGTVTDATEPKFRALAAKDFDMFVDLLNLDTTAPTPPAQPAPKDNSRVSDLVAAMKEAGLGTPATPKTWVDYTDAERAELEAKKPEVYAALFKAHFKIDYKNA